MTEHLTNYHGKNIHTVRAGSAPQTVVLLAGSGILLPHMVYRSLIEPLSEYYTVLLPSRFGYGLSDVTDAPRNVDAVVEEYRAVLDDLEVSRPVVLAAHSMGFLEALRWSQKYPEEVSALVGIDPATPECYRKFNVDSYADQIERLARPGMMHRVMTAFSVPKMLKRLSLSKEEMRRYLPYARRNFFGPTLVNEARALRENIELVDRAHAPYQIPTLFLLSNGEGTPLPKDDWREDALAYLSLFDENDSRLYDHPHDLHRYVPQEIAEEIDGFLMKYL